MSALDDAIKHFSLSGFCNEQRAKQASTELAQLRSPFCIWIENEDGLWETNCGKIFETIDGKPSENKMQFCPFCGKLIEEIEPEP